MDRIIKELLVYSFKDINWQFDRLTVIEKGIIKNQVNLDKLKKYSGV